MGKQHKHAELIKAWADGGEIEAYSNYSKSWGTVVNPSWAPGSEYRVKPEPRPQWQQDLIDAVKRGKVVEYTDDGSLWVPSMIMETLDNHSFGTSRTADDYRIKPKAKVVRWQWICKYVCERINARPFVTTTFYIDETEVISDEPGVIVMGKAEWTRTEFDE